MGDLRQEVARAMQEADLHDGDEGNHYRLFDLLGFSGENKAHMITDQLAEAAIAVVLERLREPWVRVEKAHVAALKSKGEILGEATLHPGDWDELGNAIFAVHQLLYALEKEQQP